MKNNNIYGIDKNGNLYVIDIILTYTDEIVGNITNLNNEVKRVEFYLKPHQDLFYKIIGCSDPKFDFIWKKDVICSFSKDDIIAIKNKIFHEYHDKKIKQIEDKIKDLESKHSNISYKRFNFENLDLQDEVILYSKYINKRYIGVVTSLITFDKSNFLPRISCDELDIDNVSIAVVVDDVNKLSNEYADILVFRDNNDLDNYLKYKENISIEEDIKGWKWELNGYIKLKNRGFDISF
jgi:hypothetical protein